MIALVEERHARVGIAPLCRALATGTILSREVVQLALQGPWVGGIQRAEFTVGVSGCGKRATFVVVCPEGGDGCFAAGPGKFLRDY